jgi:dTDP-4-amino-4,6-dideoxygalactose transaminase
MQPAGRTAQARVCAGTGRGRPPVYSAAAPALPWARMRVPLLDLVADTAKVRAEIDAAVRRVLDSGQFIGGAEVEAFEAALAPVAGATYAVGVSSGSDALLVALMALGIGPGDEVVTTPFTFFATAGAAARLGARLVFADVDDDSLNLDPERAAANVSAQTRAIISVHLYGRAAAVPEVQGVAIVEDAAQALGGAPLRGHCAALSFFPSKNLGGCGDGGAVVCRDAELAARLRLLRGHGAQPKYYHQVVGGNFRLDALQAAILAAKLPHLEAWNRARRERAARYRQLLAAARLPAELRVPADAPGHVYNQFVIRTPRRDELRLALAAGGIATAVYYPLPLHLQDCFAQLGYRAGSMPNAERAAKEVLALPMGPSLPDEHQDVVVAAIERFFQ